MHLELKNLQPTGSSAGAEGYGVLRGAEKVVAGRHTMAMMGYPQEGPSQLASDAEAAVRSGAGDMTKLRQKHMARRDAVTRHYVRAGELMLAHVPGVANVVDWLTKWLKAEAVETSLLYLTGAATVAAGVARACVDEYHAMVALFMLDASNSVA